VAYFFGTTLYFGTRQLHELSRFFAKSCHKHRSGTFLWPNISELFSTFTCNCFQKINHYKTWPSSTGPNHVQKLSNRSFLLLSQQRGQCWTSCHFLCLIDFMRIPLIAVNGTRARQADAASPRRRKDVCGDAKLQCRAAWVPRASRLLPRLVVRGRTHTDR